MIRGDVYSNDIEWGILVWATDKRQHEKLAVNSMCEYLHTVPVSLLYVTHAVQRNGPSQSLLTVS